MSKISTASGNGEHIGPNTTQSDDNAPKIAILLCTFNGERFLREQIDSVVGQTYKNWILYVSDDGSSDSTLAVLKGYVSLVQQGKIVFFKGPQLGFAANFISLVNRSEIQADYFSFCDQDDIWFSDKLERSIEKLHGVPDSRAALYCSRTRLVNTKGRVTGYSPHFRKEPGFTNALVQSLAGANTMLINRAARQLLQNDYGCMDIIAHDWLVYLMVSGNDGFVYYDPTPTLDYRQHEGNLIGANSGFVSRVLRTKNMLSGRFREWSTANILLLNTFNQGLTQQNRNHLAKFEAARQGGFVRRTLLMSEIKIYRQTFYGNIALVVAIALNRI
ncbi:glycosyltransferase family 2 protein [Pseudomonas sp. CCI1.2]|uniref:glycosyltransferase family 2 protein n=1 Tax=Pseudomonas sp. CCI1.2 TaxID=3048614 RepID=UPI002B23AD7E|nr:glycosyltransferase family 2 protein [Pseudomonas sp. CCI1.2]MEB0120478.1 glycosyltransferase family 2 protein [Pseudomonas sp. CCI1.2]